jgi:hypothetical protein
MEPAAGLGLPHSLIVTQVGETAAVTTAWTDTGGECEEYLKQQARAAGQGELVDPDQGDPVPADVIRPEGRRVGLADELLAGALDFARRVLAQLAASFADVPSFAAAAGNAGFADLDGVVATNLGIARARLPQIGPTMALGDFAGAAVHLGVLLSALDTANAKIGVRTFRDFIIGNVSWGRARSGGPRGPARLAGPASPTASKSMAARWPADPASGSLEVRAHGVALRGAPGRPIGAMPQFLELRRRESTLQPSHEHPGHQPATN